MAHLNDRLAADLCGEIIAMFRGLAFVPDKDPDIGEQMLHFQIKDCLAGIDIAVHLMRLDQPGDIIGISNGLIVCIGQCHTSCIGVTAVSPAFTRAIRCRDLW